MSLKRIVIIFVVLISSTLIYKLAKRYNFNSHVEVGQAIDSLNGVVVYFNGGVDNTSGRTITSDQYNLGQKYQCVEFVKRYYYQHLQHKMPDAFGHAKDFYDNTLADGQLNEKRALLQYSNNSSSRPEPDDIIVFDGTAFNSYGHIAIISAVTDSEIELIQQNPGPFGKSRERLALKKINNKWIIDNDRVLGWLRKVRLK